MRENLFDRKEMAEAWTGFKPGSGRKDRVGTLFKASYEPYYGDESFLEGASEYS